MRFMICKLCLILAAVLLSTSGIISAREPSWSIPRLNEIDHTLADLTFDEFVDTSFNLHTMRTPQALTWFGMSRLVGARDDRLNEFSEAYLSETRAIETLILEQLQTYDRSLLTDDQRIIYDAYLWYWEDLTEQHRFPFPIDVFYYPQYPASRGR